MGAGTFIPLKSVRHVASALRRDTAGSDVSPRLTELQSREE
jgi:hypothetical protein